MIKISFGHSTSYVLTAQKQAFLYKQYTMTINQPLLVILVTSLLSISACKKEDTVINDTDFYKNISAALVENYVAIYNQNVAGYPEGAVDKTVSGPLGGTVHITGSTTASGSTTTTDLLFTLTQVPYVYQSGDWTVNLTLTGDVTYNGSFYGVYKSINHQSSNLRMQGAVIYKQTTRNVDMAGTVSISRNNSDVTAVIFGHAVSY